MKRYVGEITGERDRKVWVEEYELASDYTTRRPLDPRNDVFNHSPAGFSWGYQGSGPAQLALAILCDCLGVKEATRGGLYQDFKSEIIATLDQDVDWVIAEAMVRSICRELQEQRGRPD